MTPSESRTHRATAEIEDRTRHAHAGIPQTLAAIKKLAETAWT
jgi:hypothetical protein